MKRLTLFLVLTLLVVMASPLIVLADSKYDYYEDSGSANALVYAAHHYAQTFTPAATFTLTSVKLDMHRAGDTAPDGTVSIRSTDSQGKPSYGDILSTTSFASSSITKDTDGNFYEITLTSVTLIEGIKYAIVLECNSGDNTTYIGWRYDDSGTYAGGSYIASSDGSLSWTANTDYDFRFSCWGEAGGEIYQEKFEFYSTSDNVDNDALGVIWQAQTFTTDNTAHSVDKVRLKLERNGEPGDMTVSIRATEGGYPTGLDLAYGTIDANTFDNETPTWYYIPMIVPYDLAVETQYAILVRCPDGDASNEVHWRCNEGGSYSGGAAMYSDDSGVTWFDNAGDCMFEIWGAESIRFMSAKVFTSYSQDGDWMIGIDYYAQVPPAYPTEETGLYLSLCFKTPGGTYLAKTQLTQWGNRIASIYLSKAAITYLGLVSKSPYVLTIEPTSLWASAPESATYVLTGEDWIGTNKLLLDKWVRDTAQEMSLLTGESLYTERTPAGTVYDEGMGVLTDQGAQIFLAGIPELDEIRPNLFYTVTHEAGPTHKEYSHGNVKDPETMVGSYVYDLLEQAGDMVNMSGTLFGASLMFVCFIGAIGVNVARHGDAKVGVLAAIPIALIGFYPGFWPWAIACLVGMVCVFLVLQVTILRHG